MVSLKYEGIGDPLSFTFNSRSRREVILDSLPHRELDDEPVFLPSHELLSLGARFIGLYDAYETGFEETWRDTVELLQRPALRGPRGQRANDVFAPSPDSSKAAASARTEDSPIRTSPASEISRLRWSPKGTESWP